MFFSRPNLKPLNIDLISIEGGGSRPSQFWGQTVDGRAIYIRYRGGHFGVECGDVELIDAYIGPGLHGDMLLEQACDLAGLTVLGKRLVLSEEKRLEAAENGPILDWSGRTTYWESNFQFAPAHALRFFDELQLRYPSGALLENYIASTPLQPHSLFRGCHLHKRLSDCPSEGAVTFGGAPDNPKIIGLVESSDVKLKDLAAAFRHVVMSFTYQPRSFIKKNPSFSWEDAGRDEEGEWTLRGRVSTQFTNNDSAAKAFVDTVVSAAEACFPKPPAPK
ncbi:MAG: hypothetical protein HYZ40_12890 [Rhodospirillales bacterium]|nr:hypothetical protein [Rhodospirillales bacterium]